jgi:hypothetical protein
VGTCLYAKLTAICVFLYIQLRGKCKPYSDAEETNFFVTPTRESEDGKLNPNFNTWNRISMCKGKRHN